MLIETHSNPPRLKMSVHAPAGNDNDLCMVIGLALHSNTAQYPTSFSVKNPRYLVLGATAFASRFRSKEPNIGQYQY